MKEDKSKERQSLSRRRFLKSAVAGSTAIAASSALADVGPARAETKPRTPQDPLEELLKRHGSEFGNIRQVQ